MQGLSVLCPLGRLKRTKRIWVSWLRPLRFVNRKESYGRLGRHVAIDWGTKPNQDDIFLYVHGLKGLKKVLEGWSPGQVGWPFSMGTGWGVWGRGNLHFIGIVWIFKRIFSYISCAIRTQNTKYFLKNLSKACLTLGSDLSRKLFTSGYQTKWNPDLCSLKLYLPTSHHVWDLVKHRKMMKTLIKRHSPAPFARRPWEDGKMLFLRMPQASRKFPSPGGKADGGAPPHSR